jgi:glycerol-3-phosphate dehydrogenase (NAD(P)+)
MKRIAVIGGGTWGTALSIIASQNGSPVTLWANNSEIVQTINSIAENTLYLPGVKIPSSVQATNDMEEAINGCDLVVTAAPSHVYRNVFSRVKAFLQQEMIIVSATKGIENDSLMRISQIVSSELQDRFEPKFVALSGPTFAHEIIKGHPTAAVVAATKIEWAESVQNTLSGPNFRLYTNNDVVGVEVCGAVKNIIALASGIVSGLGYGYNTTAAIITRGIADITRLVLAQGGRLETIAGLAGAGDLMLTCFGTLSRNRRVGIELGKGRSLGEIVGEMQEVAEGISTTRAAAMLAEKLGVETPIISTLYKVLYEGLSVSAATQYLLDRPLRGE